MPSELRKLGPICSIKSLFLFSKKFKVNPFNIHMISFYILQLISHNYVPKRNLLFQNKNLRNSNLKDANIVKISRSKTSEDIQFIFYYFVSLLSLITKILIFQEVLRGDVTRNEIFSSCISKGYC